MRSAFFVAGAQVEQNYDIVTGEWVAKASSGSEDVTDELTEEFYSPDDTLNTTEDSPFEILYVEESTPEPSFFGAVLEKVSGVFDSVELGLKSAFAGVNSTIGPVFSTVEGMAVDAVENYLYAVIIVVAIGAFLIVVVLMQR